MTVSELVAKHKLECSVSLGKGWVPIVDALLTILTKLDCGLSVQQIKQKFGGLRFYYNCNDCGPVTNSFIEALETHAEEMCASTCELCGKPDAFLGNGAWLMTLCKGCHLKRAEDSDG